MTDTAREAFEKRHRHPLRLLRFDGYETQNGFVYADGRTSNLWSEWIDAWQQSRREALMEAAKICERSDGWDMNPEDYAKLIRAAAEGEGK